MFAFYDTNKDGLIGFEEFVSGLAYLRGPKRFTPLSGALQGFDIDGDGYVHRNDFIRLFRAKHEIQKLIINDMIEGQEAELTRSAMDTLRSSQPISSVFSLEEIPRGEDRPRTGKVMDAYGDMQPLPGTKTILDNNEGWPDEHDGQPRVPRRPHDQLQHHSSRFQEMLSSPSNEPNDHGDGQRKNGEEPSKTDDEQHIRGYVYRSV